MVEVEEQIRLTQFADSKYNAVLSHHRMSYPTDRRYYKDVPIVEGVTGEKGYVTAPVDLESLRGELQSVFKQGIRSLAVVLKHAAVFPDHEIKVGRLAEEIGFTQISLSHQVMPMVKMVPRGFTAAADAYLTPHIKRYIDGFKTGFDEGLENVQVLFMQSDGGLAHVQDFSGHKAILSGPAGGYVGYANLTQWKDCPPNLQVFQ